MQVRTGTSESRPLADFRCPDFRCHLFRGAWLLARYRGGCSLLFACGFDWRYQFQPGLFRRAMVAMLQRLDASSFRLRSELSVRSFLALFVKIFRNCLSCHGCSVAEPFRPNCPILATRRKLMSARKRAALDRAGRTLPSASPSALTRGFGRQGKLCRHFQACFLTLNQSRWRASPKVWLFTYTSVGGVLAWHRNLAPRFRTASALSSTPRTKSG